MPTIDYKPPTELHAIAVKTYQLLEQSGGQLGPEAIAILTADLEALYGDIKQLADAVHSLGAVMLYAEKQGGHDAVRALRALIRHTKPEFDRFSDGVKQEIQDDSQSARASLTNFRGETFELRAKHVGSRPPAGSIPLSTIMPNPVLRRR
jgi:hypothetical protein